MTGIFNLCLLEVLFCADKEHQNHKILLLGYLKENASPFLKLQNEIFQRTKGTEDQQFILYCRSVFWERMNMEN